MEKIPQQRKNSLIKVVLFGPESTGKTTLSQQLATHYKTTWVPEFSREYLQKKWDKEHKICEPKDIIPIAVGQMNLENEKSKQANKLLICDTNLLETKVYSEVYYNGFVPEKIKEAVQQNHYDIYLLTYVDTPWTPDDLRDKPNEREEMFNAFEKTLIDNHKNYVILKGNKKKRFKKATEIIDAMCMRFKVSLQS